MNRLFAPFVFVALLLAGCAGVDIVKSVDDAGGDLADQAYALIAAANEADSEALEFAEKPETPQEVRDGLKKARAIVTPLVELLSEAAKAYRDAENRLDEVADQTAADAFTEAGSVLTERMALFRPKIDAFVDAIDAL